MDIMETEAFTTPMENIRTVASQKILNMIFIVDTSGSMLYEGRIEAVNAAFREMIPTLRKVQQDVNTEFELRLAIMTFNQSANWLVTPTPILEYDHKDIPCSRSVTYYSEAFKALREKLSRSGYMAHGGKIAVPYIMFMTDGAPSKNDNYAAELDELNKNGWYQSSQRFAVLIGQGAINSPDARNAVRLFVTNEKEGIIDAKDAVAIAREVQARTLRTVNAMTKHVVQDDSDTTLFGVTNSGGDSGFGGFGSFADMDFDDSSFI